MANVRAAFEVAATAAVLVLASTMVGFHVVDRRSSTANSSTANQSRPEARIDDWQRYNQDGYWIGARNAPVVITEFMDLQCPFCARLVPRLDTLLAEHGRQVAVVFHHFPLGNHPYALPGAVAAECSAGRGGSPSFTGRFFSHKSS
jgi:hypothetical protein